VKAALVHEYKASSVSKREASHRHSPLASSSRSVAIFDVFDGPSVIGQVGYGPPNGGGGDPLAELFFESLAVLFQGEVVIGLKVMWQPLFEHPSLPGGSAGDRSWLHISGLSTSL
jgi:hypothetical protein